MWHYHFPFFLMAAMIGYTYTLQRGSTVNSESGDHGCEFKSMGYYHTGDVVAIVLK